MRQGILCRGTLVVLALALAGAIGIAAAPQDDGGMDMEAMMAQMAEMAAPDEHHAHLAKMVGKWTYTAKFWMPGAPPMETAGTMEAKTLLGGRFVESDWKGEMMGMPFEGFSIDGYDKAQKIHTSSWRDNFGTMTMHYTGSCNAASKSMTMKAEYLDPMTGEKVKDRSTQTWVDDNTLKLESYRAGADGTETKMMEIVAKRKA